MAKRPVGSIKTKEEFLTLIERARKGHITIPLFGVLFGGLLERWDIDCDVKLASDGNRVLQRQRPPYLQQRPPYLSELLFSLDEFAISQSPGRPYFGYLFTNRLLAEVYRHHQKNGHRQPQSHQSVP